MHCEKDNEATSHPCYHFLFRAHDDTINTKPRCTVLTVRLIDGRPKKISLLVFSHARFTFNALKLKEIKAGFFFFFFKPRPLKKSSRTSAVTAFTSATAELKGEGEKERTGREVYFINNFH